MQNNNLGIPYATVGDRKMAFPCPDSEQARLFETAKNP